MNSRNESVLPPKPRPCGRLKPASLKYCRGWAGCGGRGRGGGCRSKGSPSNRNGAYHEVPVRRDAGAKDAKAGCEGEKERFLRAEESVACLPANVSVPSEDGPTLVLDDRQRGPTVALHGVTEAIEREAVLREETKVIREAY